MSKTFYRVVVGLLAVVVVGYGYADTRIDAEAMNIKASELTKLSTAAESTVRYKNPPAGLDEMGLLRLSSRHDPQLLQNFVGFKVRILARDKHAVVLVCTADGQRALLEDAGCTAKFDQYLWDAAPPKPCDFTLDVASVCPASVATAAAATPTAPAPVAPLPTASAGVIEIADTAWAVDVDDDSQQPTARLTEGRARQGLSLWMQVKGTAAALDKLAAEGKLPIRHKWFRETISRVQPEGVTAMTDQIDVPVAQRKLLPKLRQELRDQGYFDWRTWSHKDNLLAGTWRVRVVYADNSPVLCGGDGDRHPCEYSIEVR